MRNYKESTTFEEFAANVYSPIQPTTLFSGSSSVTGNNLYLFILYIFSIFIFLKVQLQVYNQQHHQT